MSCLAPALPANLHITEQAGLSRWRVLAPAGTRIGLLTQINNQQAKNDELGQYSFLFRYSCFPLEATQSNKNNMSDVVGQSITFSVRSSCS